jgi:opacity protein-like surface antigen/outer membrane protease
MLISRKFVTIAFVGASATVAIGVASAADLPVKAPPPVVAAVYNWSGFYAGVNAGASWGSYDPATSTVAGGHIPGSLVSTVNAAGLQSISPTGFTGGEQAGYNWQFGQLVTGVEADFNYLHMNGSANSGAVAYPFNPGRFFVVSSYAHSDWLATARGRVGFAQNNWLFYATGGLAATNVKGDFLFTDNFGAIQSATMNPNKFGYAAGAGVEWGVTDRLSVKAEYLHVGFGRTFAGQTFSNIPTQPFSQSEDLNADMVRLGVNYRFGDNNPLSSFAAMPLKAPVLNTPSILSDWQLEAGSRAWLSTGRIGAPQPLFNSPSGNPPPTILASRLIFNNLDSIAGETFARLDHSSGFFVKGFLGAGSINSGTMNDEDFPAAGAYSNTLQTASGHIGYGTIDAGYTFLKTPTAKLGAFVGYNYYEEDINTYNCIQLAGANTCTPAVPFPPNFLGISQDGHYNSMRVGLSSQFMLTDKLKFTADAAYLPWVNFAGQDDHNARELLLPQFSSKGDGVMLEAILGYDVTRSWNIGVGARYWAYNMQTGPTTFVFLGLPNTTFNEPARFNSERYGVFVQTSYKWGDPPPVVTASALPTKAPVVAVAPMNWTGFYVGGHLGGGTSDDHWSDPFGSTPGTRGTTNVAGFGDTTHGTGPLGGGQIGANWQTGNWVVGLQADISGADLRGENTCFSGLGGINCQHIINSIGTVAGRVGFAWDRSLVYVRAGGAWTNTSYNLFADTTPSKLGTGSANINADGWVAGAGLEYALTNNWTTVFEYNHIGIGSTTVPFPTVAVVNTQNISVKQSIDIFKLGVNYKFAWEGPVVARY